MNIERMNIERGLRAQPDSRVAPFFARRVMQSIRTPRPLAFPWKRLAIALAAGTVAVTGTFLAAPAAEPAAVAGIVLSFLAAAGATRLILDF